MTALVFLTLGALLGALACAHVRQTPDVDVAVLRAYQAQRRRVLELEQKLADKARIGSLSLREAEHDVSREALTGEVRS